MRLQGKVAIISGATRGMGEAQAKLFAAEGCKVIIGGRSECDGNRVESEIRNMGGDCIFVALEVTKASDWRNAIDSAIRHYDKLDILVNNAGMMMRLPLEVTSEDVWERVMDVNLKGVFLGTKLVIPYLRNSGGGSIVNVCSISSMIGSGYPAYNASKGGVRAFTRNAAVSYADENIRVNCVNPGTIFTPMTPYADPFLRAQVESTIPMGRVGQPQEIAPAVLFLASNESSYMTGAELVVDGGVVAQ